MKQNKERAKIEKLDIEKWKKEWKLQWDKSFFANSKDAYIQNKINELVEVLNEK